MSLTKSVIQAKFQEIDPFNPFGEPSETIESNTETTELIETDMDKPDLVSILEQPKNTNPSMSLDIQNVFPKSLDSSGYIILSGVALTVSVVLLLLVLRIGRAIKQMNKTTVALKDMNIYLFINQQNFEYKLLLDDLNKSSSPTEKMNIHIQIYNLMNQISKEICETEDLSIAYSLGTAFFSKILGRYLKADKQPDGVFYFKHVGEILSQHTQNHDGSELVKKVRQEYKKLKPTKTSSLFRKKD